MQFTFVTVAALFGAAMAAPAPQANETRESVQITDFSARKSNLKGTLDGPVDSISFNIIASAEAGTMGFVCTASAAEGEDALKFKPNSYRCNGGDDNHHYAFELNEVKEQNTFSLMIIHQTAPAFGFWANVDVPAYCHAGGAETMVCQQVADVTANLHL
ncbi:protein elicitor protein [Apiospora arundinis]|uniref:Protein elicitor protein n=1 Tax=Apiospora arundinis TaxID=335852 RepID=A0ABR2HY00_9PEZI